MIKVKKVLLRDLVKAQFVQRGFEVEEKRGRGLVSGSRLLIRKLEDPQEDPQEVAVRVSTERLLSFSRNPGGRTWRVLGSVDLIAGAFPVLGERGKFEVCAFKTSELRPFFDRALASLKKEGRAPSPEMPIFVPLDKRSRKNVGHKEAGLKALWSVPITLDDAGDTAFREEPFVERVKREFAELNGVDPDNVTVEFRIVR